MEKEKGTQDILNSFEESVWAVDRNLRFTFLNSYFKKDFKEAFGIDLKLGMHAFLHVKKEIRELWEAKYKAALGGEKVSFAFKENERRGIKYFRVNLNPIRSGGKITGVSAVSVDVTREKLSALKYEEEQRKAQLYLDIAGVMFVAIDTGGSVTMVNKKLCEVTGYTKEELIGKNWFRLMIPENLQEQIISVSKKLLKGEIEPVEYYENAIVTKSGEERIIAWHNTLLKDNDGNITGHLSSGSDVTEHRLAEEKVKKLLCEKEYLLKEVHHRVKNNMAALINLISLQSGMVKSEEAKDALGELENRVWSMLALYEILFQTESFRNVSIKNYLSTLVDSIISALKETERVEVEKDLEDFKVPVQVIFNIGIIINELITNAIKHAFNDNAEGKLRISASLSGDNIHLVVADNGIGIPPDVDLKKAEGFGLKLINLIVEQLGGTVTFSREEETKFILDIPMAEE